MCGPYAQRVVYVGIVIRNGRVDDLMVHQDLQESIDNVADSVAHSSHGKVGLTCAQVWKSTTHHPLNRKATDTCVLASDLTKELT